MNLHNVLLFPHLGSAAGGGALLGSVVLIDSNKTAPQPLPHQLQHGAVGSGRVALSKGGILTSLAPGNYRSPNSIQLNDPLLKNVDQLILHRADPSAKVELLP